jgi:hypothetical protein
VSKVQNENKVDTIKAVHPHSLEFNALQKVVDNVLNKSKYNKVDLGSIFSFMVKA